MTRQELHKKIWEFYLANNRTPKKIRIPYAMFAVLVSNLRAGDVYFDLSGRCSIFNIDAEEQDIPELVIE